MGGTYDVEDRYLKYTRALIDAVHDGTLHCLGDSDWETTEIFNLRIPRICEGSADGDH